MFKTTEGPESDTKREFATSEDDAAKFEVIHVISRAR